MDWLYTSWTYALILVFSLSGLAVLDWRYRLLIWRSQVSRKATFATLGCMLAFYLTWDIAGIWLKIFSTNPRYVLGIYFFTSDLPLEEILFLTLLTYVILLVVQLVDRYDQNNKKGKRKRTTAKKTKQVLR